MSRVSTCHESRPARSEPGLLLEFAKPYVRLSLRQVRMPCVSRADGGATATYNELYACFIRFRIFALCNNRVGTADQAFSPILMLCEDRERAERSNVLIAEGSLQSGAAGANPPCTAERSFKQNIRPPACVHAAFSRRIWSFVGYNKGMWRSAREEGTANGLRWRCGFCEGLLHRGASHSHACQPASATVQCTISALFRPRPRRAWYICSRFASPITRYLQL
jgi:hypothetical protein